MPSRFAPRPEPPYYAVIFSSQHIGGADYASTAMRMFELAAKQPGYIGVESTTGADGFGITVSYWSSLEAISAWRKETEHTAARERGRAEWYSGYELRIAKVERAYGFRLGEG
jgi:heme-degrading monooxygenase HmoA